MILLEDGKNIFNRTKIFSKHILNSTVEYFHRRFFRHLNHQNIFSIICEKIELSDTILLKKVF